MRRAPLEVHRPCRPQPRRWQPALLLALPALLTLLGAVAPAAAGESYLARPIYSEPSSGLQLPPGCEVDPSWRGVVADSDLEIWIAVCAAEPRIWLVRRQVIEVLNARQLRLRFEVLDERSFPQDIAGDTLSVQCTGPRDAAGYVVQGARWRSEGKQLRLKSAQSVLRADAHASRLVGADASDIDCTRFPEREAMMKRLQQTRN